MSSIPTQKPQKKVTNTLKDVDIDRKKQHDHLMAVCERGIEACKRGDWQEGLVDLAWLVQGGQAKELPGTCYSYLGYGVAKYQKNVAQGIRLCKHAIKIEWYQPDNYLNMARTCLLSEQYRRDAMEAVRDGLKVDADHPELLALHDELGVRRPPVLSFLPRSNFLNRILGSLRAASSKPIGGKKDEGKKDDGAKKPARKPPAKGKPA